jgi:hypothetical protein
MMNRVDPINATDVHCCADCGGTTNRLPNQWPLLLAPYDIKLLH